MSLLDISSLEKLKLLIDSNSKCRNLPDDSSKDEYLIRFLQAKNHDPQKAFGTYIRYHNMRKGNSELFSKMLPDNLKPVLDSGIVTKLSGKDLQGRTVFLFRFKMWNTKEISMEEVYLACVLVLEELSYDQNVQEHGVVMIHDYQDFGFSHFRQMTLRNFMRILNIMQGSFPLKFKAFHEINQPSIFYILYKAFYPLVSFKLQNRIFMHGTNTKSLLSHFPISTLPIELGGTAEELSDSTFMSALYSRQSYYEKFSLH